MQALQGLDLLVAEGEFVAIVGASGSGKSTLLSILAGVDAPTAGRAHVDGWDLLAMTRRQRVAYRRHVVGLVRQQTARNLVPYLTAAQIVDLPLTIAGAGRRRAPGPRRPSCSKPSASPHCADRRPEQMSGGEQQRVAIASRSPTHRACCSPTSRPASSTPRAPRRSSARCGPSTASSAPPSSS